MGHKAVKIREFRKSWAIIIGIDNYVYSPKLDNAVNDARDLATTLKEVGFDETIELYDQYANRESINSLLMDNLPSQVKDQDRVLIFFSGHGLTKTNRRDPKSSGYIMPYDGKTDKLSSLIDFEDFVHKTIKHLASIHVLFLIDCCFSGIAANLRYMPVDEGSIIPMPISKYIQTCVNKQCFQVITAGEHDALVSDCSVYHGHSPFTGAILHGLKTWEADLNHDGILTASELGTYITRKVPDVANVYGEKQKPVFNKMPGDEGGEFVIMVSEEVLPESDNEFRERIKKVSMEERIKSIRGETGCVIRALVDGTDIFSISYRTVNLKNEKLLQRELLSMISIIGKMFLPTIKYRITVDYPTTDAENTELMTLEVPQEIVQKFLRYELDVGGLWTNIKFFRSKSHVYSILEEEIEFELVN